ncbi:hypothetical protein Vi05172_g6005 [Venturia inaequalis]|nr:hypothetical protein Vi05172_g6005 [Venturia inaequalis]
MQFFNIVILAFVAAVSAQSTNQTSLTNQTTHVHESIPDLKKACICPPVNCPSALMSPKAVCQCKNAAAIACYKKSQGGCPVPTTSSCSTCSSC